VAATKVKKKPIKKDYIMSPSELQGLKQERNETKNILKNAESYGHGTRASEMLDKGELKRSISKYDMMIEKYTPSVLKGKSKDKVAARAKELGEFIREGMPTHNEMMDIQKNPGVPWKNLNWEKSKATAIQEWKQCQRKLEPGDPTASTVERLRS